MDITKRKNNCSVLVGGEAGYGIMSLGIMIEFAASRGGLYVFGNNEVPSLIRGGHNTYQVRMSETPVHVHTDEIHILIALHKQAIDEHLPNLAKDGIVIYDADEIEYESVDERFKHVPFKKLALEYGKNLLMRNTVSYGALMACLDYDATIFEQVIIDNFKRKGEEVQQINIAAVRAGYSYFNEHYAGDSPYSIHATEAEPRFLIDANQCTALGAIRAGCNFIAAYPMTPATTVWQTIAKHVENYNIVVKQTEDEIAAMNMIIGAGHMGARAMTATSGGGFSLMVEALGMAGMTETPCVVINSQRPGPSTGLPTRTEQGDLRFAMHASQGEFPRVVMMPGTPEQAFEMIGTAFNLAEEYQLPVIFLLDKYLSSSRETIPELDQDLIKISRGKTLPIDKKIEGYVRYEITEDGVSPRALPGSPNVHWASTDEHIEEGHLREDTKTRTDMVDKRARKMKELAKKIKGYEYYGEADADTLFVLWGSTLGAAREASERLKSEGEHVAILQVTTVIPFSANVEELLQNKRLIAIEGNSEAQLAGVIREQTGVLIKDRILRYDGRPFTSDYIINAYHEL